MKGRSETEGRNVELEVKEGGKRGLEVKGGEKGGNRYRAGGEGGRKGGEVHGWGRLSDEYIIIMLFRKYQLIRSYRRKEECRSDTYSRREERRR